MPQKCPVCAKGCYSYQDFIQCSSCFGWVHHNNRLKCSSLTDFEYEEHIADVFKPFQCDHCVCEIISKENNSIFRTLPFPVECEDNIFGNPEEISSLNYQVEFEIRVYAPYLCEFMIETFESATSTSCQAKRLFIELSCCGKLMDINDSVKLTIFATSENSDRLFRPL